MFRDRASAGKLLAEWLSKYRGKEAIVLALPRGGVVTGYEVASSLGLPLDIIAVRKIGHPHAPEYAIGAVDEKGTRILNESVIATLDTKWLAEETERQRKEALRRARAYRGKRRALPLKGKIAILVDDGIATGLTMRLAVRYVRSQIPEKIIVAVPVATAESLVDLKSEGVDEIFVLEPPAGFAGAVGAHYAHFDQVEDDEVVSLLRNASAHISQQDFTHR